MVPLPRFAEEDSAPQSNLPPVTPDTIYAVATGVGRAAICVIRLSGPASRAILAAMAGRVPPPREATLVRLRDPNSSETLDQALVLFFEAARSELGEDGAEFHVHGGPAVVAGVLAALARLPGTRPAEPGEFARRAFLNGKMDLAQIEGLVDLIDAETTWQRRQAQRQLSGAMRDATAPWRAALIAAAVEVETAIDFAEDVELGATLHGTVAALIAPVREGLRHELAQAGAAERVHDGVHIVIAGPPNAGKSTLLNAMVRREAAIVSAIAGTTRDPIEVHLDLGGCPVTLIDTAGLRESADTIERIGISRAKERADAADLVLWLSEDGVAPEFAAPVWLLVGKADLRASKLDDATAPTSACGEGDANVAGQHSLPPCGEGLGMGVPQSASTSEAHADPHSQPLPARGRGADRDPLPISAKTGENLDILVAHLTAFAQGLAPSGAGGLLARARHRLAFETALAALDHASAEQPIEILAEDLRAARFALERLIGAVDVEDILGDIFSRFCIGK